MKRQWIGILVVILVLTTVLSGCGQKSADQLVNDLSKKMGGLKSYKSTATMSILSGEQVLDYNIEIWYQEPQYYRIALTNEKNEISQIVLRNDEGVFVLTPSLKKSFKFQSDWPESQGQVYLYQSLAQSIMDDPQGEMAVDKETGNYVFDVAANYANRMLARQKIWLDKKQLIPKHVQVFDSNQKLLIEVVFHTFETGVVFEKDAFDMQRNMTGWNIDSLPAMSQKMPQGSFGIIQPDYLPKGVSLDKMDEVKGENGPQIVLRYRGSMDFTLTEQRPTEKSVVAVYGQPVDLGATIGVLSYDANGLGSLEWTHNGVEFRLTGELPEDEMVNVAQSTLNQAGK